MSFFPEKEAVRRRKELFSAGDRVAAVYFAEGRVDDNLTVPAGTEGSVMHVDDIGTVHVAWDNGVRLGILLEDKGRIIS
jgi:hypothetical protein